MRWHEWLPMFVLFVGPPLLLTAALGRMIRRTRHAGWRLTAWAALLFISCVCWLILVPMARRTNDPVGEGLLYVFLIRWGPMFMAGWLLLQELLVARERRGAPPGFPVQQRR